MALTRPGPRVERPATTAAPRGSRRPRTAHAYAEVPPPVGVALRALRLEALLGDPHDPANPYGRPALRTALPATPPASFADALAGTGAGTGAEPDGRERPAADQLVRVLRPVFRRDLALGHAWGIRPLTDGPHPHPAAALLGPSALIAAAGGLLRTAARLVDALARREPGAGQWRPVLAAAFADLLACESLTTVALRSVSSDGAGDGVGEAPGAGAGAGAGAGTDALGAVVGYVVPLLVGEVLEDLELVLAECGPGAGSPERLALAKVVADRAVARVDWAGAASCQARIVRALGETTDPARQVEHPALRALFRLGDPAPALASVDADRHGAVAATLPAAVARLAGDGDPATAALAQVARRLVTEQRALRVACGPDAAHDPADPAARALADRQALLTLAAAVLGVREAAAGAWVRFLGEPEWALLALGRITQRLGAPLPSRAPLPHTGLWDELAGRAVHGVDCDVYATKLLW